jgi:hypothetical protein
MVEPEDSLPSSQKSAVYHTPSQWNSVHVLKPHFSKTRLNNLPPTPRAIQMVFPLMLTNKNLDAFISLTCAKCSAHLKILHSLILIIFDEHKF